MNAPYSPLPPQLGTAALRVKQALRRATEQTVESLGLAAIAAQTARMRDALVEAQFELNRQSEGFLSAAHAAFDERLHRESAPRHAGATPSSWQTLSLVDDQEVELQVRAERFGMAITHACEWELRELEAYMGTVLGSGNPDRDRNPLRPEVVGHAVIRGIEAIAERSEVRKVLEVELGRSMTSALRGAYRDIVADWRNAGIQPASLTVRTTESRGEPRGAAAAAGGDAAADRSGPVTSSGGGGGGGHSVSGALGPRSTRGGLGGGMGGGTPIGQVGAGMMDLLRRLAQVDPVPMESLDLDVAASLAGALPNLIHAHRDQLRQASHGALDHMVIDVVGSLFDQILADPKLPPPLAQQIARLQLPVLRAALGDPGFFSSRRHPVRQFVNRIASLGQAFDDFGDDQARAFIDKVRALVHDVVQGDFDRIEVYEAQLSALEGFVAEQARQAIEAQHAGATQLLAQREQSAHLDRQYAERLDTDLSALAAPAFVRDFVVRVWSRVILQAAQRDGVTSDTVRQLRMAGRELFMSVQPKNSPAQRKTFLADLPRLMRTLNEGLNSIGWPEGQRRQFFGQLMPAHADALKLQGASVLDFNLMARQVEQALERALPSPDAPPSPTEPASDEALARLSSEERSRIGLLDESAVDWNGQVDIEIDVEPALQAPDLELPGLPTPAEAPEPVAGKDLAEHVQIGFSYRMHLNDGWHKVRLAHVSPGRSFFVFSHGARNRETVSLTHRMLVRLCESGRLRAYESAQLLERATSRTRRQLASLRPAAAASPTRH